MAGSLRVLTQDEKAQRVVCPSVESSFADYDASGHLLRRYVNGAAVDERVMYLGYNTAGTETARQFYHADHQGSIIAMSTAAAHEKNSVQAIYSYDVYGVIPADETGGQPFRYTGRRYDAETGLYYYRARYYSAELGRFLQTDPIGYEDNMNLYGYTANDPINMVDPTGTDGFGFTYLSALRAGKSDEEAYRAQRNHDNWSAAGYVAGASIAGCLFGGCEALGMYVLANPYTVTNAAIMSGEFALGTSVYMQARGQSFKQALNQVDNFVARVAGKIDDLNPGSVQGLEVNVLNTQTGKLVTDFDVVAEKFFVEVTGGKGRGKVAQILRQAELSNKTPILYGPNIGGTVEKAARAEGISVAKSLDELETIINGLE